MLNRTLSGKGESVSAEEFTPDLSVRVFENVRTKKRQWDGINLRAVFKEMQVSFRGKYISPSLPLPPLPPSFPSSVIHPSHKHSGVPGTPRSSLQTGIQR